MYFNPRTPVGCDRATQAYGDTWQISIHAPQWGATLTASNVYMYALFQSTHPSGVRRQSQTPPLRPVRHFNPRTPVGCDLIQVLQYGANPRFQSTHPSGVRLAVIGVRLQRFHISIHAPQWGATPTGDNTPKPEPISIHAPQWGATVTPIVRRVPVEISIHAPQWGATSPPSPPPPMRANFNPRTPVGCDAEWWPDI